VKKKLAEINYRVTTSSLNPSRTIRYSPIKGVINSCILHFPPGCNALVEVFLNIGSKQILPSPARGTGAGNVGIALDSTTQSFNISEKVDKNDPIELVVINHDNTEEHTISAILYISESETYTGP
jgi:hypothetical protein